MHLLNKLSVDLRLSQDNTPLRLRSKQQKGSSSEKRATLNPAVRASRTWHRTVELIQALEGQIQLSSSERIRHFLVRQPVEQVRGNLNVKSFSQRPQNNDPMRITVSSASP